MFRCGHVFLLRDGASGCDNLPRVLERKPVPKMENAVIRMEYELGLCLIREMRLGPDNLPRPGCFLANSHTLDNWMAGVRDWLGQQAFIWLPWRGGCYRRLATEAVLDF